MYMYTHAPCVWWGEGIVRETESERERERECVCVCVYVCVREKETGIEGDSGNREEYNGTCT